ncbi:MAG: CDP-alcohol phosphatidyltransferase family protein [Slackia sp.]|nr:CDP-alcohol phosphatidyltransferase family protein [Slackia sp.]
MAQQEQVTNRIFTLANVISFIRLCMVPAYLVFLLEGHDILATFLFALAASTDFVDGQLARRTHTVSRLGQLLDPAVDRVLMIAGVVGLLLVGRLPLWIIVVVIARDLFLLCGAAFLLRYKKRVAVVFPGKVATTLLFVGFAGLLLNFPLIPGLGICDVSWLPGFNAESVSWGIWFVYAGLVLALATTALYIYRGWQALQEGRNERIG